ncbi:hypothetical protein C8Q74DRAFT_1280489 [Fomes fomentarius]|nr:hypothetical protein C8Q74DRAFT_1280489 [Fomes fomentarius]
MTPAMVEVRFLNNNPYKSDVVNGATGERLYDITTAPTPRGARNTTIRDGQGRVVAVYTHGWVETQITYLGQTRTVESDWLQKTSWLSNSRTFTAPNGKVYKWEQKAGSRSFEVNLGAYIEPQTETYLPSQIRASPGD